MKYLKPNPIKLDENAGSFLKNIVGFPLTQAEIDLMNGFQPPKDTYPNDCAPKSTTQTMMKFLQHRQLTPDEQHDIEMKVDLDEFVFTAPEHDNPSIVQPMTTTTAFVKMENGIPMTKDEAKKLKRVLPSK